MHNKTMNIVLGAMFAALICVATMIITIPMPATGGYANPGDGIILACAFSMNPALAVLAAAIGSMLADLLAGYAQYAIATFVIKGLVAFVAAMVFRKLAKHTQVAGIIVGGLLAEICMVLGYFIFEAVILQYGLGAAASIPGNIGQGVVGIIIAVVLTPILKNTIAKH